MDKNSQPPSFAYTETNVEALTHSTKTQEQYGVGLSVHAEVGLSEVMKLALKTEEGLTVTNSNSRDTSSSNTQSAGLTIWGPSYGYQGPSMVKVCWDTIYRSFEFELNQPNPKNLSLRGMVVTDDGNPVRYQEVQLSVKAHHWRTFTNSHGAYTFYDVQPGTGQVRIGNRNLAVTIRKPGGPAVPTRNFTLQSALPHR